MKTRVTYTCNKCKAMKTIIHDDERVGRPASEQDFPAYLICGYRGCDGHALPQKRGV